MLKFEDRSIKKFVHQCSSHIIIIEKDYLSPGKWKYSIYEDNIAALGWTLLKTISSIPGLLEAKERASNAYSEILKNNKNYNEWKK